MTWIIPICPNCARTGRHWCGPGEPQFTLTDEQLEDLRGLADTPIEQVDAELRAMGEDPEAIGRRFDKFARELLAAIKPESTEGE